MRLLPVLLSMHAEHLHHASLNLSEVTVDLVRHLLNSLKPKRVGFMLANYALYLKFVVVDCRAVVA